MQTLNIKIEQLYIFQHLFGLPYAKMGHQR